MDTIQQLYSSLTLAQAILISGVAIAIAISSK